jgi:hypothetical protein
MGTVPRTAETEEKKAKTAFACVEKDDASESATTEECPADGQSQDVAAPHQSTKIISIYNLQQASPLAAYLRSGPSVSSPLPKDRDSDRSKPALWLAHPPRSSAEGEATAALGPFVLVAVSEAPPPCSA